MGEHLASMRLPWFVIADASSPPGAGDPNGAAGIAEALSLLLPILAFPPVQTHWPPWAPTDWAVRSGEADELF